MEESIKREIRGALHELGFTPHEQNTHLIYRKHLNDPQDRPMRDLILMNTQELT